MNGYFDHIVDVTRIRNAKPSPDIFTVGGYIIGVEPEECVGIEDAAAGIEAIRRAGFKAVGVGKKDQMKYADLFVENTKMLKFDILNDLLTCKL